MAIWKTLNWELQRKPSYHGSNTVSLTIKLLLIITIYIIPISYTSSWFQNKITVLNSRYVLMDKLWNHSLHFPPYTQVVPVLEIRTEALIASLSAVHRHRDQPKLTSHWYGPIDKALIRMSKNVLKCHRWSFLLARVAFHWDSFFRLSCLYFCSTEIEINRTKSEFFFFFIVTSWTGCCRFRTWSRWRSVRRPWRSPSRGWSRCPRGRSCGSPGTWSSVA